MYLDRLGLNCECSRQQKVMKITLHEFLLNSLVWFLSQLAVSDVSNLMVPCRVHVVCMEYCPAKILCSHDTLAFTTTESPISRSDAGS